MKKSLLVFENGGTYLKLTRQVLPCPPNNSLGVVKNSLPVLIRRRKRRRRKWQCSYEASEGWLRDSNSNRARLPRRRPLPKEFGTWLDYATLNRASCSTLKHPHIPVSVCLNDTEFHFVLVLFSTDTRTHYTFRKSFLFVDWSVYA